MPAAAAGVLGLAGDQGLDALEVRSKLKRLRDGLVRRTVQRHQVCTMQAGSSFNQGNPQSSGKHALWY